MATSHVHIADDFDALFKLPVSEFTSARNALAARLKKTGQQDEAARVKALSKPSISAWAVNQLYWKHRDAFDRLIATGERCAKGQAAQLAGKTSELRVALEERREAISELSRLAAAILRDSGHNPTPETIRRISATLEALSTGSKDTTPAGRLTDDLALPGFDTLAAFAPTLDRTERPSSSARVVPFNSSASAARQARIANAKAALEIAERALRETKITAENTQTALKEATAQAAETERERNEAEKRLQKASAAADAARRYVQSLAAEATRTAKLLEDAAHALAKAQADVESVEK